MNVRSVSDAVQFSAVASISVPDCDDHILDGIGVVLCISS
jgi:hypothetical protein